MQNGTRGNSRSLRQSPRTVVTVAILLLTSHLDRPENRPCFKTLSAEMADMFGVPLREIGKLRSSGHGLKTGTDGEQLAFAQTISPSAPTSLHGTPSFTKRPPKSAVHTLHPCRKVFEMGPVFCFIGWESHRIIS